MIKDNLYWRLNIICTMDKMDIMLFSYPRCKCAVCFYKSAQKKNKTFSWDCTERDHCQPSLLAVTSDDWRLASCQRSFQYYYYRSVSRTTRAVHFDREQTWRQAGARAIGDFKPPPSRAAEKPRVLPVSGKRPSLPVSASPNRNFCVW